MVFYNPFAQVTEEQFRQLITTGYRYFILQRFEWPGVKEKTGFLLSPYIKKEEADLHSMRLNPNEGKIVRMPDDAMKVGSLLKKDSGYRIFLNQLREVGWENRMLRVFEDKIVSYLRFRTTFKRSDPINILFTLESGRVYAIVSNGKIEIRVPAIDILK